MYEFTLLAPIALSAACKMALAATWLGFGWPCCAAAGTIMAADDNNNIPILCLIRSSPILMVPSGFRIEWLKAARFGKPIFETLCVSWTRRNYRTADRL